MDILNFSQRNYYTLIYGNTHHLPSLQFLFMNTSTAEVSSIQTARSWFGLWNQHFLQS